MRQVVLGESDTVPDRDLRIHSTVREGLLKHFSVPVPQKGEPPAGCLEKPIKSENFVVEPKGLMITRPFARSRGAFTLLELVIVVSILSILAGAVAPNLTRRLAKTRDARRIADMQAVQAAIELFNVERGRWPQADANPSFANWDVSHDGGFISELRRAGYLLDDVGDPLDSDLYHYRYRVYSQGAFGCQGYSSFYVLGVREFETEAYETSNSGFFVCSGRNWNDEFDYVTGGGATEH